MYPLSARRISMLFSFGAAIYLFTSAGRLDWTSTSAVRRPSWRFPFGHLSEQLTLANASQIYVISLPRRTDRRRDMERLRRALGLNWNYVDAVEADDALVSRIFGQVKRQRSTSHNLSQIYSKSAERSPAGSFQWPEDINVLSSSNSSIPLSGADDWDSASVLSFDEPESGLSDFSTSSLTCAIRDNEIPPFSSSTPLYMILTPAKIACWHSHLSAIRNIANAPGSLNDVSIIVEDDIDMEYDIKERLDGMWPALPSQWDMVFLGHCWSNESLYPPLLAASSLTLSSLHPSNSPKCTHAYALTKYGARRLLLHLRYPPFAYSRPLDQAYAWLIRSGRLTTFSVVPSIVVQRKVGESDIWKDKEGWNSGSSWRDRLVHGVLEAD